MSIDPVSLAITAALSAASMALNMTRKIEGPRLEDLNVTVADYGTPLNYFYGTRRLQVPIFWAEGIKEKKKQRKTKGGKYNEYTYYGTWAVAIADHEIDAVTRVWFDTRLVYDATNAGPIGASPIVMLLRALDNQETQKSYVTDYVRIYLGTEDQEPDPRMLATVEDEHGAGSCPAYRGVAYLVFEEVPLEKVGNRIPQVKVEAIRNATSSYPWAESETTIGANGTHLRFSPNFSYFFWTDGSTFEVWDTASRSPLMVATADSDPPDAVDNEGTLYAIQGNVGDDEVIQYGQGSSISTTLLNLGGDYSDIIIKQSVIDGHQTALCVPFSNGHRYATFGIPGAFAEFETPDYQIVSMFADLDGNIWGVGGYNSTTTLVFERLYGFYGTLPHRITVTGMPSSLDAIVHAEAFHFRNGDVDHFIIDWDGHNYLVAIDLATLAISLTLNISSGVDRAVELVPAGADKFWLGTTEYDSATLTVLRTYSTSDLTTDLWDTPGAATPIDTFYDPVNHALVSRTITADTWTWRFLDRVTGNGVTLGSIASDVFDRCGIASASYETSDLTQIVQGYSWTQGAGKAILEPLLDLYDADVRPHNFKLQGVTRGDAAAGTIDVSEFVGTPRYTITVAQDTDLPRRITLSFADLDKEQQPNSVVVQRPLDSVDGVRETSVDLTTLALDVDEARNLAERFFRRLWNSREMLSFKLTAQRMTLEPADVWDLALDDVGRTARLGKIIFAADDSLHTEWTGDDPSLVTQTTTTGATMDGRIDSVIAIPVISQTFMLDIPLLNDAHNDTNPLLYYGAGPFSSGIWPGAEIYQAPDYDIQIASVPSNLPTTWGRTTGVLATATPAVWDRKNTVNVRLNYGTLTSATEADCNASPILNLCLVGSELLQFTTATLQGDGSYTLSGLKRGRRGTEWATSAHASGEQFCMVDSLGRVEMGASDIGDALSFKAVTVGRDIASAFPANLTYEGNTNKPYAPAHFRAVKDAGTGDWVFTWVRRSRIGYRWTGNSTVPLGESTEEYDVKIMNGGSVVRTITVSSETATWTAAQQTTDFGSGQSSVTAKVLQVGDLMDGRETTASFP